MPTYDGIGSSITHEIEVVGDVFISNVEGGSLSTQVPFEIFSNVYGMATPPTDSRQVRLRVQPTTQASPDDSYVSEMGIQNTTDNYFFITAPQNTSSVGDQNTFVISKTSNVGIGLTNPGYQLQLSTDSAGKPSTSTWSITSDQRIKEDIVDANLDTCYENVKNLKLKYYKLRDDIIELDPMFKDSHKLGWIAQEVEKVLPKCVTTIPEQYGLTEVKNLNTDQIHVNLFGAVQKLIKDNENLKARIEALENRV